MSEKRKLPARGHTAQRVKSKPFRLLHLRRPNVEAKSAMAFNATQSPLLKLPAEIREIIYGYVVGGELIHVDVAHFVGEETIRHWLCSSAVSEDEAYKLSLIDSESCGYSARHSKCIMPINRYGSLARKKQMLALEILRTCRQIYQEAALLPYSSNIVSFCSSSALRAFVSALLPEQRRALHSLHLRVFVHDTSEAIWGWNDLFTSSFTKSLSGLRILHLDLRLASCRLPLVRVARIPQVQDTGYILHGITNLQRLPLKTVTVIVDHIAADDIPQYISPGMWGDLTRLWTHDEMTRWAELVRGKLLSEFDEEEWKAKVALEKGDRYALRKDQYVGIRDRMMLLHNFDIHVWMQ